MTMTLTATPYGPLLRLSPPVSRSKSDTQAPALPFATARALEALTSATSKSAAAAKAQREAASQEPSPADPPTLQAGGGSPRQCLADRLSSTYGGLSRTLSNSPVFEMERPASPGQNVRSWSPRSSRSSPDRAVPVGAGGSTSPSRGAPVQLLDFANLARVPPSGERPPAERTFKLPRAPAFMASPATAEGARRSLYGPKARRAASPPADAPYGG